jgi:hypothetical protein
MRDAQYLRAQAELCLEMARNMADAASAEGLRAEAARYLDEAEEFETRENETEELEAAARPTSAEHPES